MNSTQRIQMEDFKRLLNREIELYNTIERVLDIKKQVIIRGDLEALVDIDNQLEQLTLKAQELEKDRLTMLVHMGQGGATLKTFIESLTSGEDAQMLQASREKMLQATESIKTLSHTNMTLLQQSIHFIEQSVEVIASILAPEGASYHSSQRGDIHRDVNGEYSSTITRDA